MPEKGSPWKTLNDYEGSHVPPETDPLEVCVRGADLSSPIDVTVIVDGKETVSTALDGWDCVDLGVLPRDTQITAVAVNSKRMHSHLQRICLVMKWGLAVAQTS